jgi:hypothetical protein
MGQVSLAATSLCSFSAVIRKRLFFVVEGVRNALSQFLFVTILAHAMTGWRKDCDLLRNCCPRQHMRHDFMTYVILKYLSEHRRHKRCYS